MCVQPFIYSSSHQQLRQVWILLPEVGHRGNKGFVRNVDNSFYSTGKKTGLL